MSATKSTGTEITADVGAEGLDKGKTQQKSSWDEDVSNSRQNHPNEKSRESKDDLRASGDDPFDLDTAILLLNVTNLQQSCKKINKLKTRLEKKRKNKEKGKKYQKGDSKDFKKKSEAYKELYNEILIQRASVESIFDKSERKTDHKEGGRRAESERRKPKSRPPFSHIETEKCETCQKKETMIWKLEADIEKSKSDATDLQRKVAELEKQIAIEKSEKKDALRRSKCDARDLQRKIAELEKQIAIEKSEKEEALRSTKEQDNRQRQEWITEKKEKDIAKEESERYKENWKKAEDEKIQLEKNIKELNRTIEEYKNEKVALHLNHKEELGVQKEENRKLKERLEVKTNQLTGQLDAERKAKEDALIRLEKINKDFEHEVKSLKTRYNRVEEEKRKTEYEFQRLEAKTNQLTGQLDTERKAKEDALIRLSSMASNKLRDNNPNIADLSDPNRPTKLSEQFSELYDNEWTDAFDELEKELKIELKEEETMETKIISYLRDILLEIHSICNGMSSERLKGIEKAFVVPFDNTKVPTEVFKMIKDAKKSMAPYCLEGIGKVVLDRLEKMYSGNPVGGCLQHKNVKRYIDKCTDVCWYMSVQDPQVFMDGSKSPNGNFDSNKHREYTKKGPCEDYVVWPVLYLYKDGQMLSKGVAQGKKMENKKETTEHE